MSDLRFRVEMVPEANSISTEVVLTGWYFLPDLFYGIETQKIPQRAEQGATPSKPFPKMNKEEPKIKTMSTHRANWLRTITDSYIKE